MINLPGQQRSINPGRVVSVDFTSDAAVINFQDGNELRVTGEDLSAVRAAVGVPEDAELPPEAPDATSRDTDARPAVEPAPAVVPANDPVAESPTPVERPATTRRRSPLRDSGMIRLPESGQVINLSHAITVNFHEDSAGPGGVVVSSLHRDLNQRFSGEADSNAVRAAVGAPPLES